MKPPPGGRLSHQADSSYFLLRQAGNRRLSTKAESVGCCGVILAVAIVSSWPGRTGCIVAVGVGFGSAVTSRWLQLRGGRYRTITGPGARRRGAAPGADLL